LIFSLLFDALLLNKILFNKINSNIVDRSNSTCVMYRYRMCVIEKLAATTNDGPSTFLNPVLDINYGVAFSSISSRCCRKICRTRGFPLRVETAMTPPCHARNTTVRTRVYTRGGGGAKRAIL